MVDGSHVTSRSWLHLPGQHRAFPCDTSQQWKHGTPPAHGGYVRNKGVIRWYPCYSSIGGKQHSHVMDQPTHQLSLAFHHPVTTVSLSNPIGMLSSRTVSVPSWKDHVCFQLSIPLWTPFRRKTCRSRPLSTRRHVLSLLFHSLQRIRTDKCCPLRTVAKHCRFGGAMATRLTMSRSVAVVISRGNSAIWREISLQIRDMQRQALRGCSEEREFGTQSDDSWC